MVNLFNIKKFLSNRVDDQSYRRYWDNFSLVKVNTAQLRKKVLELRYDVFYEEKDYGFDIDENNHIETDAYDEHAAHYALIQKKTGYLIGTIRFIHPETSLDMFSLPIQEVCDHPLLHDEEKITHIGEISRFCVMKSFRKREGDGPLLSGYYEIENPGTANDGNVSYYRRHIAFAPLSLLGAAIENAMDRGITDCVMAVDPADLISLEQLGMDYHELGPVIKNYGYLQPVIFNIPKFLNTMKKCNPSCWDIMTKKGKTVKRSYGTVHGIYNDIYDS